MQFLNTILGFAMTVAAINIHLEFNSNCKEGGGLICTNANPNNCCGIPSNTFSSINFRFIPRNWYLELRGHEGGNCARLKTVDTIFNGESKCLNSGSYTGAGYGFRSSKREEVQEGSCSSATESCTSTQKPDVLYLADGQHYDIASMDDGLLGELVGLSQNGTIAADIPKDFKEFEITV